MNVNASAWIDALGLSNDDATKFERLANDLDLGPTDVLRLMVERVVRFEQELSSYNLSHLKGWLSTNEIVGDLMDDAVGGLPVNVRPTNFMWPSDKPFPWTPEECKAAVIGYEVKWSGDFRDFMNLLRGEWEMSDGYAFLRQR